MAQQSLRSVLSFCNSPQMNAIEAYIQFTPGLITDDGEIDRRTSTQEVPRRTSDASEVLPSFVGPRVLTQSLPAR